MVTPHTKPCYLFVLPWDIEAEGGVNQVVLNLYRRMEVDGRFEPWILTDQWGCTTPEYDTTTGYRLVRAEVRSPLEATRRGRALAGYISHLPQQIRALGGVIEKLGVTTVNPHFFNPSAVQFALLRRMGRFSGTLLLSFHSRLVERAFKAKGADRVLWRFLLEEADGIITVSRAQAQAGASLPLSLRNKIHVVPNGVDLDPFSAERAPDADLISELGISPSRPMILTIGHVKATKATDVLVQAVPFIKAKVPDVQVVVAGSETPFIEEVKRLAVENGVKENLVFLGEVEHGTVPALLARADVFVLPSRSEGLPIALLEAGAARLPVVATRVGGIPEVVEHGVNGYLVEPDDPPALGEHLAKLLLDPALREQFGERLFAVVQGRLSWENTYQGYLAAHHAGRARNASLRG